MATKKANNMLVRDVFHICSSVGKGQTNFIAGVELEIESFDHASFPHGWKLEEDGSLRNHGMEIISCPSTLDNLVDGFSFVHGNSIFFSEEEKFSPRTSIHVHVNCLNQTMDETKNIILWYALFEPVFFAMCDPARRHNIHCVGLEQTILSEYYKRSLSYMVGKWSKYTALNIKPLETQGTIEFRHMEGHDDVGRFAEWLTTIKNLWTLGQEVPMCKEDLSPKLISDGFDWVFGHAPIKSVKGSLTDLICDGVLDVKLALA